MGWDTLWKNGCIYSPISLSDLSIEEVANTILMILENVKIDDFKPIIAKKITSHLNREGNWAGQDKSALS